MIPNKFPVILKPEAGEPLGVVKFQEAPAGLSCWCVPQLFELEITN